MKFAHRLASAWISTESDCFHFVCIYRTLLLHVNKIFPNKCIYLKGDIVLRTDYKSKSIRYCLKSIISMISPQHLLLTLVDMFLFTQYVASH